MPGAPLRFYGRFPDSPSTELQLGTGSTDSTPFLNGAMKFAYVIGDPATEYLYPWGDSVTVPNELWRSGRRGYRTQVSAVDGTYGVDLVSSTTGCYSTYPGLRDYYENCGSADSPWANVYTQNFCPNHNPAVTPREDGSVRLFFSGGAQPTSESYVHFMSSDGAVAWHSEDCEVGDQTIICNPGMDSCEFNSILEEQGHLTARLFTRYSDEGNLPQAPNGDCSGLSEYFPVSFDYDPSVDPGCDPPPPPPPSGADLAVTLESQEGECTLSTPMRARFRVTNNGPEQVDQIAIHVLYHGYSTESFTQDYTLAPGASVLTDYLAHDNIRTIEYTATPVGVSDPNAANNRASTCP